MRFIDETKMEFQIMNSPFPHTVIDGFLKTSVLPDILQEMEQLTPNKSYYFGNQEIERNKYAFKSGFDIYLTNLFKELNSDEFIDILERKTRITGIIRNNLELEGAGVHKVYNGGFLCMHTDFEAYYDKQYGLLDRRLNLLLYMNPEWSYKGGELCLFDKTSETIVSKVAPLLNRCVIFLTPGNIHGHPMPLELPQGVSRQSITTYYYTHNTTGLNINNGIIQPVKWYHDIKDLE